MKRILFAIAVLIAIAAVPALAQTAEGPSIEPTTMEAILVLIAGGIVTTVTGLLKSLLKLTGNAAVILTGVVAVLATAVYFLLINPPFDVLKFALYGVAVFGEATGYFHFYKRST